MDWRSFFSFRLPTFRRECCWLRIGSPLLPDQKCVRQGLASDPCVLSASKCALTLSLACRSVGACAGKGPRTFESFAHGMIVSERKLWLAFLFELAQFPPMKRFAWNATDHCEVPHMFRSLEFRASLQLFVPQFSQRVSL